MYKISTETGSIAKYVGDFEAIRLIKEAGFDAFDYTMISMCDRSNNGIPFKDHPLNKDDYIDYVIKLKKYSDELGIHCNQTHAPFPTSLIEIQNVLPKAIEITRLLGADICIIHPMNNYKVVDNNELYKKLIPYAEKYDVKLAFENMWNWDKVNDIAAKAACSHHLDFKEHVNYLNSKYVVACLDIGHAEMRGLNTSSIEMIDALGDKLQALHIHDNDLIHDLHQIPFSNKIDFQSIVNELKKINYNGYLTLEADTHTSIKGVDGIEESVNELARSIMTLRELF